MSYSWYGGKLKLNNASFYFENKRPGVCREMKNKYWEKPLYFLFLLTTSFRHVQSSSTEYSQLLQPAVYLEPSQIFMMKRFSENN